MLHRVASAQPRKSSRESGLAVPTEEVSDQRFGFIEGTL
jgi:hypothetical protein